MAKRKTTEQFIHEAEMVHGKGTFDYSAVEYKNNHTPVDMICSNGHRFSQRPGDHLHGHGCPYCAGLAPLTNEIVIERSIAKHGNRYGYGYVDFKNTNTPIDIECFKHGIFSMLPWSHFGAGQGCPDCARMEARSPVFGVGINDYEGVVKIGDKHISSYNVWHQLMKRLFSEHSLRKHSTYRDVEICEDWKYFSRFKKWYDANSQYHHDGWELDKDVMCNVLGLKTKIYSPSTCLFLPPEINTLFIVQKKRLSTNLPVGIRTERSGRYSARMQNGSKERIWIGTYDTIDDAFNAYKSYKESRIKQLADKYKPMLSAKAYESLLKYEVRKDG